jgi:hypothetical protein
MISPCECLLGNPMRWVAFLLKMPASVVQLESYVAAQLLQLLATFSSSGAPSAAAGYRRGGALERLSRESIKFREAP